MMISIRAQAINAPVSVLPQHGPPTGSQLEKQRIPAQQQAGRAISSVQWRQRRKATVRLPFARHRLLKGRQARSSRHELTSEGTTVMDGEGRLRAEGGSDASKGGRNKLVA